MINFDMFKFFVKDKAVIEALESQISYRIEEVRGLELTSREQKKTIKKLNDIIVEMKRVAIPVEPLNFNVFDFAKLNAFSIEIMDTTAGMRTVIGYINPTNNTIGEWFFHWGEYHNSADHLRLVADFNSLMNKVSLAK